jgi:hypothetical protein
MRDINKDQADFFRRAKALMEIGVKPCDLADSPCWCDLTKIERGNCAFAREEYDRKRS